MYIKKRKSCSRCDLRQRSFSQKFVPKAALPNAQRLISKAVLIATHVLIFTLSAFYPPRIEAKTCQINPPLSFGPELLRYVYGNGDFNIKGDPHIDTISKKSLPLIYAEKYEESQWPILYILTSGKIKYKQYVLFLYTLSDAYDAIKTSQEVPPVMIGDKPFYFLPTEGAHAGLFKLYKDHVLTAHSSIIVADVLILGGHPDMAKSYLGRAKKIINRNIKQKNPVMLSEYLNILHLLIKDREKAIKSKSESEKCSLSKHSLLEKSLQKIKEDSFWIELGNRQECFMGHMTSHDKTTKIQAIEGLYKIIRVKSEYARFKLKTTKGLESGMWKFIRYFLQYSAVSVLNNQIIKDLEAREVIETYARIEGDIERTVEQYSTVPPVLSRIVEPWHEKKGICSDTDFYWEPEAIDATP